MMRKVRTAVLTGIAALAIVGVSLAAAPDANTINVNLPDGSVARIEYSGGAAPKVTLAPASHAVPMTFAYGFDSISPAALDHVAGQMDRQAAAMIHQAAQLPELPVLVQHNLEAVALGKLPPGTAHYEVVKTSSENGACTRSVEMISYGSDEKPRIVLTNSADCRPLDRTPAPALLDTPVHPRIPGVAKPPVADNGDRAQVHTIV